MKVKGEVVGPVGQYSYFLLDSDTINILFELGGYIKEF
jgi:hypothetical protein